MQGGDANRANFNQKMRRQMNNAFAEKKQNYSPSTSYNYNPNSGHREHREHRDHNQNNPRRRSDRFKRELMGLADRMVKQNNTIIKLLNEICDRLPEPERLPENQDKQEKMIEKSAEEISPNQEPSENTSEMENDDAAVVQQAETVEVNNDDGKD